MMEQALAEQALVSQVLVSQVQVQQRAWSWLWWSWLGQVPGWGAELDVGEEEGGEELGVDVELVVGLAPALVQHHLLLGKWSRKRSHPPSSTGSTSHHHKSPCMASSHAHPHR